jgi:hypothetical protein
MQIQETLWEGMDWIDLALDRGKLRALVDVVMNFHVTWNAGNLLTNWGTITLSSMTLLDEEGYIVGK